MLSNKTLIINTDGRPLGTVCVYRALGLIYINKRCVQIDFYEDIKLRDSKGICYPVPSVIMTKVFVHKPIKPTPISRRNVIIRDNYTCQYCGKECESSKLTIDHIIPKSRWRGIGTAHNWLNIVAACKKCNNKKADYTIKECGMHLLKAPHEPKTNIRFMSRDIPECWKKYIYAYI